MLCFAARPLTIPELIDSIAVDVKDPGGFQPKRRLQGAEDIHQICPGLIDVTYDLEPIDEVSNYPHGDASKERYSESSKQVARISHFSVQEYLESERIKDQQAVFYNLNYGLANTEIAQICLTYLLDDEVSTSNIGGENFPLAVFAAKNWPYHYRRATLFTVELDSLTRRFLLSRSSLFKWTELSRFRNYREIKGSISRLLATNTREPEAAIYCAAALGLDRVLSMLLKDEESERVFTSALK